MFNLVWVIIWVLEVAFSIHWWLRWCQVQFCKKVLSLCFTHSHILLPMCHQWLVNHFLVLFLLRAFLFSLWLLSLNRWCCLLPIQAVKYFSDHLFIIFWIRVLKFTLSFIYWFLLWLYRGLLVDGWIFIILVRFNFCALRNLLDFIFFHWGLSRFSISIRINLRIIFFRCQRS